MRAGGGGPKGGAFEREICKRLSLWVTNGESADVFRRSAMSGGKATVQRKSGLVNVMESGDVCAVDPRGYPFVAANFIELKHYKNLGIARGFLCQTNDLYQFWVKAVEEARSYGKRPLLVARQNLYPTIAVTGSAYADAGIFAGEPIVELRRWGAFVYLFDEVTEVRRRMVRRAL